MEFALARTVATDTNEFPIDGQPHRDTERRRKRHRVRGKPHDQPVRHFHLRCDRGQDRSCTPAALALKEREISVWYDEFELRIGDSLRQKIDAGIANSRFGLVVLSRSFFAKGWPQYELDGLVTRVTDGKQVLLPIWHEVSKDEVVAQSPSLADKVALRKSDLGIDEMADEIASVIAERS